MGAQIFKLNQQLSVVYSRSQSEVVHVGLMSGVGSRNDGHISSGISHFVEHMWFKGTKNRTSRQIIDEIELLGGDFNAYTSKEETCIHVSVLKNSFKVALEVLLDIFFCSEFPADELVKEREVILDEIDSYEDSPSELIFDDFEELLFQGTSLSKPILGNKESLVNIDTTLMKSFYVDNYLSSKTVLSFVGNVSFSEFKIEVERLYSSYNTIMSTQTSNLNIELFDQKIFAKEIKKKTSQSHCVFGCKAFRWNDNLRLPMSILNNILGGPYFSSILNYSLREKNGLTYNIESSYTPYSDTGSFVVYFGTDKKKVETCYDIIKKEFKLVCESNLLSKNLAIYKQQVLGQLALSYESNVGLMVSQAKSVLIYDKVDDFKEISRKITSIDSQTLQAVANDVLDFDKMSFLVYN
jgi:predicted Zn-dependent peptidase